MFKNFEIIKKYKNLLIFLAIIFSFSVLSFLFLYKWGIDVVKSDGRGYYSYLPAIFDYGDLTFQYSGKDRISGVWQTETGRYVNKYPIGVALLQFPFFTVADIFCKWVDGIFISSFGTPYEIVAMLSHTSFSLATGYSLPYQILVYFATTFYFIFGLVLLYKYLKKIFLEKIVMWTMVTLVFATNMLHYAIFDASFSHIYSFFLITSFIYVIEIFKPSIKKDLLIGFLLSMIFITRNPNAIIGLFYLFYKVNNKESFKQRMKEIFYPRTLCFNILGALLPIVLQCSYWFYATGHFIVKSYHKGETFSWFSPHVFDVLFSVEKGMLLGAPALSFAFLGFFVIKKQKNEISFFSFLSVILVSVYVTSSWNCWWYGHCLWQRSFVDFYFLFAVLMAGFFDFANDIKINNAFNSKANIHFFNIVMKPTLILMILLSLKFTFSYWNGMLSYEQVKVEDVYKTLDWKAGEIKDTILKNFN